MFLWFGWATERGSRQDVEHLHPFNGATFQSDKGTEDLGSF